MTIHQRAQFPWRSPPRLRRWRLVFPDNASSGETPQSAANEASDLSRSGLSPATTKSTPATSVCAPRMASICGAFAAMGWWSSTSRVSISSTEGCERGLLQVHTGLIRVGSGVTADGAILVGAVFAPSDQWNGDHSNADTIFESMIAPG